MYECPNCGGNLKFDIPSQQLACPSCASHFDPYAFETKQSDAEESTVYETTIFTCPQCGGEITSTDNSAAEFCSFCGASTILFGRISNAHRPQYIIPFQQTKEDCKKSYASLMKKAIFAPKEFRNPKHIDSFRGIYMPYWAFYITQAGPIQLSGSDTFRRGDYLYTNHYRLTGDLDAYYKGLSFDASSSFSDNISEAIAPYEVRTMKRFTPAFLSGFYADTADVSAYTYEAQAKGLCTEETFHVLEKEPAFSTLSKSSKHNPSQLNTRIDATDLTMFPVWFMSYRNGDRIAYATVNGQTGKVSADIPVDIKKYLLGSLILAVPIWIILNILPDFFSLTLKPATLLSVTAIFSIITMIITAVEAHKIIRQEAHEDDRGYLAINNPQKLSETDQKGKGYKPKKAKSLSVLLIPAIYICVLLGSTMTGFLTVSSNRTMHSAMWVVYLIAAAISGAIALVKVSRTPGKKGMVPIILHFVALTIGYSVILFNPVYDFFFYGAAILILGVIFFSLKAIMDQHNILSTRPLPQFKRTGGDDRA